MALIQHEKNIMGHDYSCVVFTGTKGLQLLGKLTAYVGKASVSLKNISGIGIKSLAQLQEEDGIKVITTVAQMLPELMDDDFVPFTLQMFKHAIRDGTQLGKDSVFDEAFAGNYCELFAALGWIIYINYGEGLKDVFTKALDRMKEMGILIKLSA